MTELDVVAAGTGEPPTATTVDRIDDRTPADVPTEWVAAMRLAARIHQTPFVPKALRGDPHSVLACILTGQELGLGPMQSLRMVNVIEGRPAASAELMRALVNRAGHRLSVVQATIEQVTLYGRRTDTGADATVTWTLDDARRAQLLKNPAWGKYPRSMLLARATSELCRQIFSDVIGGLYTPEESAAIEGRILIPETGELIDPVTDRALSRAETAVRMHDADDELDRDLLRQAAIDDAADELDADRADRQWIQDARGDEDIEDNPLIEGQFDVDEPRG